MQLIETAYHKALDVLRACVHEVGFYASGLPGGYEALWARDSMTAALGASYQKAFKKAIKNSLETLTANQTELGLIPNCVGSYNIDRQSDVTFNSVDAPLWYIIGHYVYAAQYNDTSIIARRKDNIKRALHWLKCQDSDNLGLIAQQPTTDWQDAFPHKYGYTIHNNSLFYAVLKITGKDKAAAILQKTVNGQIKKYAALYDGKLGYYYPWGWKNHDAIREREEWFDTAGNLLAIITGLATHNISKSILNHIKKQGINQPYPCKAIWPPIKRTDKAWHDYFELCNARDPYQYLNAGIWPFIGGLYVAALVKIHDYAGAKRALDNLAQANLQIIKEPGSPEYLQETAQAKKIPRAELKKLRQKEFNEWLDGRTGKPKGEPYQAWSAGAYIYAYECVKRKNVSPF